MKLAVKSILVSALVCLAMSVLQGCGAAEEDTTTAAHTCDGAQVTTCPSDLASVTDACQKAIDLVTCAQNARCCTELAGTISAWVDTAGLDTRVSCNATINCTDVD
eukprot:Skav218452  [mRNA]  locus=scaffold538:239392:239709:- [translate_table: standard]